jgi:hypothetical protein
MTKSASPKSIHAIYPNNMGLENYVNPLYNPNASPTRRISHYKRSSFKNPFGKSNKSKNTGRRYGGRKTARRSRSKR